MESIEYRPIGEMRWAIQQAREHLVPALLALANRGESPLPREQIEAMAECFDHADHYLWTLELDQGRGPR